MKRKPSIIARICGGLVSIVMLAVSLFVVISVCMFLEMPLDISSVVVSVVWFGTSLSFLAGVLMLYRLLMKSWYRSFRALGVNMLLSGFICLLAASDEKMSAIYIFIGILWLIAGTALSITMLCKERALKAAYKSAVTEYKPVFTDVTEDKSDPVITGNKASITVNKPRNINTVRDIADDQHLGEAVRAMKYNSNYNNEVKDGANKGDKKKGIRVS